MSLLKLTPRGLEPALGDLRSLIGEVRSAAGRLTAVSTEQRVALLDDFAARLIKDERTQSLEGVAFLAAWLKRANLEKLLALNLNGNPAYLDGFCREGATFMAAQPHGLVAMWLAGNVATLPLFSIVPAILTRNACIAKLGSADAQALAALWNVFADSSAEGVTGHQIQPSVSIVYFARDEIAMHEALSRAADAKVVWGGAEAVRAIRALPERDHCVEIIFGPKYSIGLMDRKRLEGEPSALEAVLRGFSRDIAMFDQRACSSPQTIFVERNDRWTLRAIGELLAQELSRLPPKPAADAYTTMQILNARADWALAADRDLLVSGNATDWTICMDRESSLKTAVQSRTVFLTEIGDWRDVIPLLSPKVQTVGMAFEDAGDALTFAAAATAAGVARCVRPGLMNVYESPWDGKLLINQLVRWVVAKP